MQQPRLFLPVVGLIIVLVVLEVLLMHSTIQAEYSTAAMRSLAATSTVLALAIGGLVLYMSKQNQIRLRGVYDALALTQEAITILNRDGQITYANAACRSIFGIAERVSEDSFRAQELFAAGQFKTLKRRLSRPLTWRGFWSGEIEIQLVDGQVLELELSVSALPNQEFVCVLRDISARKQADAEHAHLQQQFFRAQKMEALGRLAGGIAHDFNNILASINGYAHMLRHDLDPDTEASKFADNICVSGERAAELVSQILAFSRSRETVNEEVLDLATVACETERMLQSLIPSTIQLRIDLTPIQDRPIGQPLVLATRAQLNQVMMNLMVNARDAIVQDTGRITLSVGYLDKPRQAQLFGAEAPVGQMDAVQITPRRDGGGGRLVAGAMDPSREYLVMTVADDGAGMSSDILARALDAFYTTKPNDQGTGLGLSAVHGLVLALQGVMVIDTEEGHGTTFTILLPKATPDALIETSALPMRPPGLAMGEGQVLVVDDDASLGEFLRTLLERLGYGVSLFSNASDALDYLGELSQQQARVELLITDQTMPGMAGIELILRARRLMPDLKTVLCTGYSEVVDEAMALEAGADLFVPKPIQPAQFSQALFDLLLCTGDGADNKKRRPMGSAPMLASDDAA